MTDPAKQLALQLAAALAVLSLAWPLVGFSGNTLDWRLTAGAIGAAAFLFSWVTHQPIWWRAIHALFAPAAWAVAQTEVNPGWFLFAFIGLQLVYRGAVGGRIPLFLSNRKTVGALLALLNDRPRARFIDLGGGIGSVVAPLADSLPEATFAAIENAPLTWLAGRLRTAGRANCRWYWGDFWGHDLGPYDVVYAFLSPEPMPALWQKARNEMPPGSLLISNSFAVHEVAPDTIINGDGPCPLYCYRMG